MWNFLEIGLPQTIGVLLQNDESGCIGNPQKSYQTTKDHLAQCHKPSPSSHQLMVSHRPGPVAHGGMLQKGKVAANLVPSPGVDAHQQQGQRTALELCVGHRPGKIRWESQSWAAASSTSEISGVWGVLNCFQDL